MTAIRFRNLAIGSALLATLIIAVYVSIPDFPYKEKAWQVNLWGEPSGWWSEVTWIIAFGLFSSLVFLFRSWFYSLGPDHSLIMKARAGILFTAVSWNFFTVGFLFYFKPVWHGFYSDVMLDRTGILHGLFYLSTAHIGLLAAVFGLALFARIVHMVGKKTC